MRAPRPVARDEPGASLDGLRGEPLQEHGEGSRSVAYGENPRDVTSEVGGFPRLVVREAALVMCS